MMIAPSLQRLSIALLALSACAMTRPAPVRSPTPPLGTIGVVALVAPAEGVVDVTSGTLAGASRGAGQGARAVASGFAPPTSCSAEACAVVLAIMAGTVVGGALVGAVVGASQAVPAEVAEEIAAELRLALDEVGLRGSIEDEVLRLARDSGLPDVRRTAAPSPASRAGDARTPVGSPDVDTVVEIDVVKVVVTGGGGTDPTLTVEVHTLARFVDVVTSLPLRPELRLDYVSAAHKLSEWNSPDGQLLKGAIARAYTTLAQQIIGALVSSGAPVRADDTLKLTMGPPDASASERRALASRTGPGANTPPPRTP